MIFPPAATWTRAVGLRGLKRYYKYSKKLWSLESKKLIDYIAWDYKIELEPEINLKFFLTYKLT